MSIKGFSLELSYYKITEYKALYKDLNDQIKNESKHKKELAEELSVLERKQDALKTTLIDKEEALKSIQRKMGQCQHQIRTKERMI